MSGKFNVDIAVEYIEKHASAHSGKKCATHVREALQAGGLIIYGLPIADAKDYGLALLKSGFIKTSGSALFAEKGDVVVIQNYPGGNPSGHIAMYTGEIWISDFKQRDMWAGSGYRTHKPEYAIYRPNL